MPVSDGTNETAPNPSAVLPDEVAGELLDSIEAGNFYAVCNDGDQTVEQFKAAAVWYAQDITEGRPPLSRWHPEHRPQFLAIAASLAVEQPVPARASRL